MGWNDHVMGPGYDDDDEIEYCKHGKRYNFKTGEAIDECPECKAKA